MRSFIRALLACSALLIASSEAQAIPVLQIDILGGHYDPETQTVYSSGTEFTLVALLTPRPTAGYPLENLMPDTFYISAAVTPKIGPVGSSIGSFTWDGTTYSATGDMEYGTPPIEAIGLPTADPGDLPDSSIFPTFFREFGFQFSPENRTVSYDVAEHPGGLTPTTATTGVSYFQMFNITTSLAGEYALHFDLYDTYLSKCSRNGSCSTDIDIEQYSPIDGQSSVPEPTSSALLVAGLAASWFGRRRMNRAQA